ncbi:MAG TPA: hypothetical protein VFN87_12250 [Solirubrobacteraceae bacterium]|nr:hypothetical protein [Solirubrobacteraceae bacterium]
MSLLAKVDSAQKATTPTAVAVATFKKFSEDQSTNLAATEADHRALQAYAEERSYHEDEEVRTDVRRGGRRSPPHPAR